MIGYTKVSLIITPPKLVAIPRIPADFGAILGGEILVYPMIIFFTFGDQNYIIRMLKVPLSRRSTYHDSVAMFRDSTSAVIQITAAQPRVLPTTNETATTGHPLTRASQWQLTHAKELMTRRWQLLGCTLDYNRRDPWPGNMSGRAWALAGPCQILSADGEGYH